MSEEWISAREAGQMVSRGGKFVLPMTAEAIRRRAASGLVRAKAELFTVEGRDDKVQHHDRQIRPDFWELTLEKEDWVHGNFLGVQRTTSWEIRCEALGVAFERKGIEAMVSGSKTTAPLSQSRVSENHSKGGAPGKYDWARAVGTVVFQWADSGTWQPTSLGEVQTKLADWFSQQNQTPDDRLLKQYARWLVDEFRKRKAEGE